MGILEAAHGTDDLHLHVERQAGGDPVRVEFVGGQAFRLDEDLVRRLVGKTGDLVLDRRAVTRPNPLDHPGVHGAAIQVVADHLVGELVGMGNVAGHLTRVLAGVADEGEDRARIVAVLGLHHR